MTKSTLNKLAWLTPILATITAVLDAGHLSHVISSEVSVLVFAILTAIVGYITAMSKPDEESDKVEQFNPPQPQQQQPQPQKK